MEKWKKIKHFKGYEVSSLGRVRSLTRTVPYVSKWGTKTSVRVFGKILRPGILRKGTGYKVVSLSVGRKQRTRLVHRLVAEAFIPNPHNLPEVNHKGSTMDCRAHRLEWRSKAGNMQHAVKSGKFGKFAGVYLEKRRGQWVARYWKGKHIYVGTFSTKKLALQARQLALKTLQEVL